MSLFSGEQTRLPIFESDGEQAAEEGTFDLEISEPSLCGGEEVHIFNISHLQSLKIRLFVVFRWSLTILLTKFSRMASCSSTAKNVRTLVLTLRSIATTSSKQSGCFVDRAILPGRLDVLRERSAWRSAAGPGLCSLREVRASRFVRRERFQTFGIRRTMKPA